MLNVKYNGSRKVSYLLCMVVVVCSCTGIGNLKKPVSEFQRLTEQSMQITSEYLTQVNEFERHNHFLVRKLHPHKTLDLQNLRQDKFRLADIEMRLSLIVLLKKYSNLLVILVDDKPASEYKKAAKNLTRQLGQTKKYLAKTSKLTKRSYSSVLVKSLTLANKLLTASKRKKSLRAAVTNMDKLVGEIVTKLKGDIGNAFGAIESAYNVATNTVSVKYDRFIKTHRGRVGKPGIHESYRLALLSQAKIYVEELRITRILETSTQELLEAYRKSHADLLTSIQNGKGSSLAVSNRLRRMIRKGKFAIKTIRSFSR